MLVCLNPRARGRFGLGFSVVLDAAKQGQVGSIGNFGWGGAASTYFWVDPEERMVVVLMTQLMGNGSQSEASPYHKVSKGVPVRSTVARIVYSAVVDGVHLETAQKPPMLPNRALNQLPRL